MLHNGGSAAAVIEERCLRVASFTGLIVSRAKTFSLKQHDSQTVKLCLQPL